MTSRIIPSRPFDHPAAWTVADIGCKDAFAFDLTDRHIAAFEAATQGVRYHKGEGGDNAAAGQGAVLRESESGD